MEMPMDILNHRLGKLRDSGVLEGDNTAYALDIDSELQEKFQFIPQEEIDKVDIISPVNSKADLQAGDGPEAIRANYTDNPNWLYNSAVHALAMYQHLIRIQKEEAQKEERAKVSRRPLPGLYAVRSGLTGVPNWSVMQVTGPERAIKCLATNGRFEDRTQLFDDVGHQIWTFVPLNEVPGAGGE